MEQTGVTAPIQELSEHEIKNMSASELVSTAYALYQISDTAEQARLKALYIIRAKEVEASAAIKQLFRVYDQQRKDKLQPRTLPGVYSMLARDGNDRPLQTIDNILIVMENDPAYSAVRFDLMKNAAVIPTKDDEVQGLRRWTDADTAASKHYIEKRYGIYSAEKHVEALRLLFKRREYNPLVELVQSITWDGEARCETFLSRWGQCDDTPYTREVSRLIFAGGIWRLMRPGCKFDDVPLLIGKQGTGKSTLCRIIALHDDYFGEVKEVESDKAIENINGKWICEITELSAFTRAREIESIKAYITRQRDQYRKPYDREVTELLRRCIFIGTTNNENPLIDKTGNRRFYPVHVRCDGYELFDRQEDVRAYALQCWAEALTKFNAGEMPNYARKDLRAEYEEAQKNAMQDDWRVGAIGEYLRKLPKGYQICAREIQHKALTGDDAVPRDPTLRESREIAEIMTAFPDWERKSRTVRVGRYGMQRVWERTSDSQDDALPF